MDRRNRAFTLIELLVVIAIILILIALLSPAVLNAVKKSKITNCRATVKQLEAAWQHYNREYAVWPDEYKGQDVKWPQEMAGNAVKILGAIGNPMGDPILDLNNPRKIPFMQFPQNAIAKNEFDDIWRRPFRFALDTDYNGDVTFKYGSSDLTVKRSVVVWSAGPDGKDGTKDDVTNWGM